MEEAVIGIRKARPEDAEALAELILRFYTFNEEFDPAWSTVENAREKALERAKKSIEAEDTIVLVAVAEDQVIGYALTDIFDTDILAVGRLAVIRELYVKPQYRGRGVASRLVDETQEIVKEEKNIQYLAAQFPTANFIAERFYKSRKFRPFISIYLREV